MTCIAQLHLQGFQSTAVVGVLPVRATCGLVELLLQLRCGTALAVDLEQRALFRSAEPILRALSSFPLFFQIARKPFPDLRQLAVARGQRRPDPRQLRLQRLPLRVAFRLRLV